MRTAGSLSATPCSLGASPFYKTSVGTSRAIDRAGWAQHATRSSLPLLWQAKKATQTDGNDSTAGPEDLWVHIRRCRGLTVRDLEHLQILVSAGAPGPVPRGYQGITVLPSLILNIIKSCPSPGAHLKGQMQPDLGSHCQHLFKNLCAQCMFVCQI